MKQWNTLPGQDEFPSLEAIEIQVGQEPVRIDIEISDFFCGNKRGRDSLLRSSPGLLSIRSKLVIQI